MRRQVPVLAVVGAFTIALLKQHGHGQGVPGGAEPSTRGVCGYRPPRVPKLMPGGGRKKTRAAAVWAVTGETPISPQVASRHCTTPRGRAVGAQREGSKSKAAREQGTETIPASRRGAGSTAAAFGGDVAPRQGHGEALPHAGGSCTVSAFAQHPPGERGRAPKPSPSRGG